MKNILFLMLMTALTTTSCRTAFPEAQTPDDVYYSPEWGGKEYERIETDEDRYLRMKVRNRRDWDDLNEWYTYERWTYRPNFSFGTPFHPYYNWNVLHNPYWGITTAPRVPNRPRVSNLSTFENPVGVNNTPNNPVNPKLNAPRTPGTINGSPRNNNSVGGGLRDVFGNGNRSGSVEPSRPSNSSPSTPSAPVRKF